MKVVNIILWTWPNFLDGQPHLAYMWCTLHRCVSACYWMLPVRLSHSSKGNPVHWQVCCASDLLWNVKYSNNLVQTYNDSLCYLALNITPNTKSILYPKIFPEIRPQPKFSNHLASSYKNSLASSVRTHGHKQNVSRQLQVGERFCGGLLKILKEGMSVILLWLVEGLPPPFRGSSPSFLRFYSLLVHKVSIFGSLLGNIEH